MSTAKTTWSSPKEVAETVGVDERTVRRWCNAQQVDARVSPGGGIWRVKVDGDGFPVRR